MVEAERMDTVAEKRDMLEGRQTGFYIHTCVACVAKEEVCSLTGASRKIK